jgi:hypothetical protein
MFEMQGRQGLPTTFSFQSHKCPDNGKKAQPKSLSHAFLSHGSPSDSSDRFFLFTPWSEIHAVELSEGRPLAMVKRREMGGLRIQVDAFQETSHKNLINLKHVFLENNAVSLVYELASVSLKEIREAEILTFGIAEVATTCREVSILVSSLIQS